MKTHQLRSIYLDFFKSNGHKLFSSASLIPGDDPTLLFTGAGMNQFKPYFLGIKKDVKRATSVQKCIRTADLENVGRTNYHHTFFEMLGNFSFGDYFKEEAIQFAWKFVTSELKLSPEDLWVSVYLDDDEAFNIWKKKIGIAEKRIVRYGAEDNFWPSNAPTAGPNGPCGPCSEIYYGKEPGKGVEIWNLVFTEFDRQEDGLLKPLPQKNIDTGMGLERLAAVMQGVESNFDTDLFVGLGASIEQRIGSSFLSDASNLIRHAVLDHLRAVVFSISDGIMPSNEGRGYVVRKLIRKATLHLRSAGLSEPSMHLMAPAVEDVMSDAYPELKNNMKSVSKAIHTEEEAIWNIIENKVPEAEIKIKSIALTSKPGQESHASMVATRKAFEFYDTYGVPVEILQHIVQNSGISFDSSLFDSLLNEQRDRSRAGSSIEGDIFAVKKDVVDDLNLAPTQFTGYEQLKSEGHILALIVDGKSVSKLEKGQKGILISNTTPFYAEQGGQVGDTGTISNSSGKSSAEVEDTKKYEDVYLHHIKVVGGELCVNEGIILKVDENRRNRIRSNHTATHLLHKALSSVLGDHVKQRGSLVAEDRLRFDFSHHQALTPSEISSIEQMVNDEISRGTPLSTKLCDKDQAISEGAVAFFGEKYSDEVRVVSVGNFSVELCGGTHVSNTADIQKCRIISEGSIQSGVRRIEAVTKTAAQEYDDQVRRELGEIADYLGCSVGDYINGSYKENRSRLESVVKRLRGSFKSRLKSHLRAAVESAQALNGVKLLLTRIDHIDKETLKTAADWITDMEPSIAAAILSSTSGKVSAAVVLSPDLVSKGMHAGNIVRDISKSMNGNGGGKPQFAMGGGDADADLVSALAFAGEILKKEIQSS